MAGAAATHGQCSKRFNRDGASPVGNTPPPRRWHTVVPGVTGGQTSRYRDGDPKRRWHGTTVLQSEPRAQYGPWKKKVKSPAGPSPTGKWPPESGHHCQWPGSSEQPGMRQSPESEARPGAPGTQGPGDTAGRGRGRRAARLPV
eukprot:757013-Hanusia_phi.AAC.2